MALTLMTILIAVASDPPAPPLPAWSVKEWSAAAGLIIVVGGVVWVIIGPAFDDWLLRRLAKNRDRFATVTLDALGESHDETKGMIERLFVREIERGREVHQLAHSTAETTEANRKAITSHQEMLAAHAQILPAVAQFGEIAKQTAKVVNEMREENADRLGRIEGYLEGLDGRSWDGKERRRRSRE